MTETVSFAFRALHPDGSVVAGVIEAPSREAAASFIGAQGLFPLEVAARGPRRRWLHRAGVDELAAGLRALAALLRSGLPMSRALSVMQEVAGPAWADALPGIRRRIEQGESLAVALEKSSLSLPPHVIGIVRAGEAGSGLAGAVDTAARLLEQRAAARAALRNALAYPIMLAVAGSASVGLMVSVVLPRFAEILADTGQALPMSTRILLRLGQIAPHLIAPSAIALVVAAGLARAWLTRPDARRRWHAFLLSVPVIGSIRRAAATANAASALAALLRAGVPLSAALPHAGRAAGDSAFEVEFLAARDRIARGEPLSTALGAGGILGGATLRLIRVGEETGDLAGMLGHAADIESAHAARRLQRALRLVEPALIVVFGGIVLAVAAAMLQAMYGYRLSP